MLDFITNFDWASFFSWETLLAVIIGSFVGMLIGALPGLGSSIGVAICIPFTYALDAKIGIVLLISLYMASSYGGSISAITLGIPGQAGALATVFDGARMAKNGQPGRALGISLYASTIGGVIGCLILMLFTKPLSGLTTKLTDPELFVIAILGLLTLVTLGNGDVFKTLQSIFFGLMLGCIGMDAINGSLRYTFKQPILYDGLKLVPILTGLFAVSEVFNMVMQNAKIKYVTDTSNLKTVITREDRKACRGTIIKSSIIGVIFGIIPGLGCNIAAPFSYTEAKRSSKKPETFGTGSAIGIAAPESANNACVAGALIPFLTIGIPGAPTVAIMASALIMKGIQPGPTLMSDESQLVYFVYWGLLAATIVMFVMGKYLTRAFSSLLTVENYILAPIVLLLALVGSYCTRYRFFDVWVALAFGIIGFFFQKLDYSVPAFSLAFVLASLVESRFRRSLVISHGNAAVFFNRPVCIAIWVLLVLIVVLQAAKAVRERKAKAQTPAKEQ